MARTERASPNCVQRLDASFRLRGAINQEGMVRTKRARDESVYFRMSSGLACLIPYGRRTYVRFFPPLNDPKGSLNGQVALTMNERSHNKWQPPSRALPEWPGTSGVEKDGLKCTERPGSSAGCPIALDGPTPG